MKHFSRVGEEWPDIDERNGAFNRVERKLGHPGVGGRSAGGWRPGGGGTGKNEREETDREKREVDVEEGQN